MAEPRGLLTRCGNVIAFVFSVVIAITVGCALSIGDAFEDRWAEEKRRPTRSTDRR